MSDRVDSGDGLDFADGEVLPDVGKQHSVEKEGGRLRRQQDERDNALGALLEHRQGRALVWHLLERCGVFAQAFAPDPYVNAWRTGKREVGVQLLEDVMRVSSGAYAVMQREAADRRAS